MAFLTFLQSEQLTGREMINFFVIFIGVIILYLNKHKPICGKIWKLLLIFISVLFVTLLLGYIKDPRKRIK